MFKLYELLDRPSVVFNFERVLLEKECEEEYKKLLAMEEAGHDCLDSEPWTECRFI